MFELVLEYWQWLVAVVVTALAVWAAIHVVLTKTDGNAAVGWLGLIWFVPVVGTVFYFLFGINRIQRKARRLKRRSLPSKAPDAQAVGASLGIDRVETLYRVVTEVTGRAVSPGNRVRVLLTGEAAYTEMLAGIAAAERTVGLCTYIFDNDQTGRTFVDALAAAVRRGVAVRVLIDDTGSRYSFPSVVGRLRAAGVPEARFLPSLLPWRFAYAQLRNHRKLLVVDGRVGYTGGMNIRDGHDARTHTQHPITDCHFRIDGPVVGDYRAVFADDWHFTTGEQLAGPGWFPALEAAGAVTARGIASGPDDDTETLRLTLLGAIACARRSVRIVTPYFLPDPGLVSALHVAALRGVRVDIVVPEENNLRLVQWAMMGLIANVLKHGCRVWLSAPPFDHSKLFLVDDEWCLIGSANWDARSLRLNFEFTQECYDSGLVSQLNAAFERKMSSARRLTPEELKRRNFLYKLRDGVVRLAAPYL